MQGVRKLSSGKRRRVAGLTAALVASTAVPVIALASGGPQAVAASSVLAFPGAEGAGAQAKGGRGGDVYFVTNLNDSGAGSLRQGISTAPSSGRTILFKVSGTIALQSNLDINGKSNLTIAGQTAPGDGIALRNHSVRVGDKTHDLVMRHIRLRTGSSTAMDGMWISSGSNIVIDHVSASWGSDEVLSATRDTKDLTVQNTFITEALNPLAHAFGSLIDSSNDTTYSYHHNLWANHISRNPRPGTSAPDPGFKIDFRNNVIHNWGYAVGYSASDDKNIQLNYVNNYLTAGPSSTATCAMEGGDSSERIYQSGNKIDLNKNGKVDGTDTGWGMFCGSFQKQSAPHSVPAVATDSADSAYLRVLAQGGATPWRRDPVDKRVVGTVRSQTGKIINTPGEVGGYPTLNSEPAPADADSDGMPDFWEQAMGLNPNNASDRNVTDSTGYTMLENYLNWLADGHAVVDRNGSVDVDLQALNGGLNSLSFTVASGSNGSVSLLGDGHTARFTPAAGHVGLANFSYSVSDSATGFGFGPVRVGVLVKGTGGGTTTSTTTSNTTTSNTTTSQTTSSTTTTTTTTTKSSTTSSSATSSTTSGGGSTGGCTASYKTVSTWSGGFQGEVTVTAGSAAISSWTTTWTLASGQAISQVWNGALSTSGSKVTVTNVAYNGAVSSGASTTFGFLGTGNASTPAVTCTSR